MAGIVNRYSLSNRLSLYFPGDLREAVTPSFRSSNSPKPGMALKRKRFSQIFLLAVSLVLSSLPISARAPSVAFPPASTLAQATDEKFVFGKVDQDLLEEINLLDQRFEKEGAVYHDTGLDAYLNRVGAAV